MNTQNATPEPPDFEPDLVAYLDGELDAAANRQVEERMLNEPGVQQEVRRLERAWQLLDELPRTAVDDTFTRSTVAMVALAAADDLRDRKAGRPVQGRRAWLAGGIAMAVAALAGFIAYRGIVPHPNDQLTRDLLILRELDAYQQAGDIEFLRLNPLGTVWAAAAATTPIPSATLAERERQIASMNQLEKEKILHAQERFSMLSPVEQARLRRLDAALDSDPHAEERRAVMRSYAEWVGELDAVKRAELSELASAERAKRVVEFEDEIAGRKQRFERWSLPPEDRQAVRLWLWRFFESRVPLERRKELNRGIEDLSASERAFNYFSQMGPELFPNGPRSGPNVKPEEIADLRQSVSSAAQAKLDVAGDLRQQQRLVGGWVFHAFRGGWQWPGSPGGNQWRRNFGQRAGQPPAPGEARPREPGSGRPDKPPRSKPR